MYVTYNIHDGFTGICLIGLKSRPEVAAWWSPAVAVFTQLMAPTRMNLCVLC